MKPLDYAVSLLDDGERDSYAQLVLLIEDGFNCGRLGSQKETSGQVLFVLDLTINEKVSLEVTTALIAYFKTQSWTQVTITHLEWMPGGFGYRFYFYV